MVQKSIDEDVRGLLVNTDIDCLKEEKAHGGKAGYRSIACLLPV